MVSAGSRRLTLVSPQDSHQLQSPFEGEDSGADSNLWGM